MLGWAAEGSSTCLSLAGCECRDVRHCELLDTWPVHFASPWAIVCNAGSYKNAQRFKRTRQYPQRYDKSRALFGHSIGVELLCIFIESVALYTSTGVLGITYLVMWKIMSRELPYQCTVSLVNKEHPKRVKETWALCGLYFNLVKTVHFDGFYFRLCVVVRASRNWSGSDRI